MATVPKSNKGKWIRVGKRYLITNAPYEVLWASEWQGFTYLCGYTPRVSVGMGTGMKFVTLEKPVPAVQVHRSGHIVDLTQ